MALAVRVAAPVLPLKDPFQRLQRRSTRVWLLVGLIAAASLIDLHLTLTHLRTVGMIEANPLARWVIEQNCAWFLTIWKVWTVGLALSILLWNRTRASSEAAAWFCAGVMIWLMLQWIGYAQHVGELTPVLHKMAHTEHMSWVSLTAN